MKEVMRVSNFSPEIINTETIKNNHNILAGEPEKDEQLLKNITLGSEELSAKKEEEKRKIIAITIVVILLLIIVMFGIFAV